MPFQKGVSGNPGGRSKQLREVVDLARAHTAAAIATIAEIMKNRDATPSARVAAAVAILDRGHGKPPQFIAGDPAHHRKASEMTDDEIVAILDAGAARRSGTRGGGEGEIALVAGDDAIVDDEQGDGSVH